MARPRKGRKFRDQHSFRFGRIVEVIGHDGNQVIVRSDRNRVTRINVTRLLNKTRFLPI